MTRISQNLYHRDSSDSFHAQVPDTHTVDGRRYDEQ